MHLRNAERGSGRRIFGSPDREVSSSKALISILTLLAVLMLLAVTACGQASSSRGQDSPKKPAKKEQAHKANPQKAAKKDHQAKDKAAKTATKNKEHASKKKSTANKEPKKKQQAAKNEKKRPLPNRQQASVNQHKSTPASQSSEAIVNPPSDPTLYLTVPRLGIYNDTVANTNSDAVMNQEAIKLPSTGFPWQRGANTYIAGHRLGYAGTQSYYQFYNLPSMKPGDVVILKDANGNTYTYQVTRVFAVTPQDVSVTAPVPGQTTVTLQTCITSLTDWWSIGPAMYSSAPSLDRLIVQAKQVSVNPA